MPPSQTLPLSGGKAPRHPLDTTTLTPRNECRQRRQAQDHCTKQHQLASEAGSTTRRTHDAKPAPALHGSFLTRSPSPGTGPAQRPGLRPRFARPRPDLAPALSSRPPDDTDGAPQHLAQTTACPGPQTCRPATQARETAANDRGHTGCTTPHAKTPARKPAPSIQFDFQKARSRHDDRVDRQRACPERRTDRRRRRTVPTSTPLLRRPASLPGIQPCRPSPAAARPCSCYALTGADCSKVGAADGAGRTPFCLTPIQRRHKQPGAGGNPASQTLLHYRTGGKLPLPAASGSYDFPARAPGKNRMNPVMKVA